jgi:enoyl-CoA hydratase/carnithine racemase
MTYSTIIFEKGNGIGIITLNRFRQMNALNNKMIEEIFDLLSEIALDCEIKVVIFTGHEKFFCVGADLIETGKIDTPVAANSFTLKVQSLFNKIEDFEKPVIAAVSGYALGGGCELTLACDLRIAAENAMFGQPEIKIGIIPGGGGTQRLPRIIGVSKAKELLYTGDPINAKEALRIGLVNSVVKVESLMEEASIMAEKLLYGPGFALKMLKSAVSKGINMDIKSAMAYEARCFEVLFSTQDLKEGLDAFIEKRRPVFVGR